MNKLVALPIAALTLTACQTTSQQPARVFYPVETCGYQNEPIYGIVERGASDGEVLGGAVIGGVIGDKVSDGNGAAAVVGAIIGASVAGNNRVRERAIVGYKKVYKCWTEYK